MQQVPLKATIVNPDDTRVEMTVGATLVVGATDGTECEGGHGSVRTYLTVDDGEAALDWCLVCIAQQMLDGTLTSLVVR